MLITVSLFATTGFILAVILFKSKPPLPPPSNLTAPKTMPTAAYESLIEEKT